MTRSITTGCPIIHVHNVTKVEYDADATVYDAAEGPDSRFSTRHLRIYDKSGYCVLDINLFSDGKDSEVNTLPQQWIEPEADGELQ
jgi:hypothetical protein